MTLDHIHVLHHGNLTRTHQGAPGPAGTGWVKMSIDMVLSSSSRENIASKLRP